MAMEITLDELRRMAFRSGLRLSEDELEKVLPGVNRSHRQVSELRELLSDRIEPAAHFPAASGK